MGILKFPILRHFEIYTIIVDQPSLSVQQIFNALDKNVKDATPDFDTISLKYFISVIKDGIQNDY